MVNKTLITPKNNPDLDGLACAYAYSRLLAKQGQKVTEGIFGDPHVEAQYLIDRFHIDDIVYNPSEIFNSFILVDASDVLGMPDILRREDVIEVVDHRELHRANELFPNAAVQIEKVGSAATQIVEKYQSAKVPIDQKSALLLYGAIYSNTLNFKATITTQRDRNAIDWLLRQAQIPNGLAYDMFVSKTESTKKHLEKVLRSDYKEFLINSKKIGISQLEVVGLDDLVMSHLNKILSVLDDLEQKHDLEFAFLTAVDLEGEFNLFITKNISAQILLEKVFGIKFKDNVGKKTGMLLRKQIIPLILSQSGN